MAARGVTVADRGVVVDFYRLRGERGEIIAGAGPFVVAVRAHLGGHLSQWSVDLWDFTDSLGSSRECLEGFYSKDRAWDYGRGVSRALAIVYKEEE